MIEVWKDIHGYEGLYRVSNIGRVKSLDRVVTDKNGRDVPWKGKILRLRVGAKGYIYVCLSKDCTTKQHRVHRLVAKAFIQNVNNKKQINHIDGKKNNNKATNLEWCTCKENIRHAFITGLNTGRNATKRSA